MSATDHDVCKVCKKAHGHREPHVWGDDEPVKTGALPPAMAAARLISLLELQNRDLLEVNRDLLARVALLTEQVNKLTKANRPVNTPDVNAETSAVNSGANRAAYMREYMRAKRAKA